MAEVVIADTSCLIALTIIGRLELLNQVYERVWITPPIAAEYGLPLPAWFQVADNPLPIPGTVARTRLDPGESSAIALALTM